MTDVTVDDATAFLERLMLRDPGVIYRLPTVDEWEYAARAGSRTDYFFGDDPSELDKYGNCEKRSGSDGYERVAPIGSFKPNRWGLYDVHGNVTEWVEWPEGAGMSSIENGKRQALRLGGSLKIVPSNCTFSGGSSQVDAENNRREDTGLRLVRELSED